MNDIISTKGTKEFFKNFKGVFSANIVGMMECWMMIMAINFWTMSNTQDK